MTHATESTLARLAHDRLEVTGRRTLLLDDPQRVYVVAAGQVEVFLVRLGEDGRPGPRTFVLSADPGTRLPTAAPDAEGYTYLATGTMETQVWEFGRGDASGNPELAAAVDALVRTAAGVVTEREQTGDVIPVEEGTTVDLESEERAACVDGVLWCTVDRGQCRYLAAEVEPPAVRPVTSGLQLTAAVPSRVRAESTAIVLGKSGTKPVDEFTAALRDWAVRQAVAAADTERERLVMKLEVEQRRNRTVLAHAASILVPEAEEAAPPSGHPMLAACRLVGEVDDIEFSDPPRWLIEGKALDPVGALAQAAGVRHREVALRGKWWTEDSGAILGFRGDDDRPVALLPTRGSRYTLVDPSTNERLDIDAEVAEEIDGGGYVFYRPLPERSLGLGDLARFLTHGLTREAWTIVGVIIAGGVLGLLLPLATGYVFSSVIPSANDELLLQLFAGLLAAAVATFLLNLTRAFAFLRVEGRASSGAQAAVFDRLLRLPAPFFRRFTVGDLVSRVQGLATARMLLSGSVMSGLIAGVTAFFNVVLLFYYDIRLAIAAILLVLFAFLLLAYLVVRAAKTEYASQEIGGRVSGFVLQLLKGIGKIRVAVAERRAFTAWLDRYSEQVRLDTRGDRAQGHIAVLIGVLPVLSALVIFGTMGWLISRGSDIHTGAFIGFNAALGTLIAATVMSVQTLNGLLQIGPYVKRIQPILAATPESTATRPDPGEIRGRIQADCLRFRYDPDGPLILDNVSFEAKPGEFIALVGPSGSGKSTALRCLLGFETPESGAVYYDGQDLDTVDATAVRRQLGVVLQSSRVMSGDIFTNIVGSAPLTIDDAWEAAEMAGLADDIHDMPMGMFTVISEGGSTFSGGQIQRLLIARALVRKPRIIFFDEATSALDNRTQKVVSDALDRIQATRIAIAHRLSTIRNADRIYVIVAGKLVESGSFEELMALDGTFAHLAARQTA